MVKPQLPRSENSDVAGLLPLKSDDIDVVFQPIVDLRDHSTFAIEALVRCKLPSLTVPSKLFEHAAANDYCGALGRLIRERTIARCGGYRVFVNIHPIELIDRWLIQPDDPIFTHDSDVYLEITESVPFLHYELCVSVLSEIRKRGRVYLVVDDLGAGYSNLKRIVDLHPEVVKLDRELITGLDHHARQRLMVTSIVHMCKVQGALVVGEGIETPGELKAIISCGVHYGQGYLLAKPSFPIPPITWPPSA
jgi:EAL domain-containing protein (putative c-di-GMP-specific phosphodiesterase class I)